MKQLTLTIAKGDRVKVGARFGTAATICAGQLWYHSDGDGIYRCAPLESAAFIGKHGKGKR